LKESAEREGGRKVLKRCVDALCFWSAAAASQQQRKPGQDTLRTQTKILPPPSASPASRLGGAGKALLAGLVVLALEVAGCVWLESSVKTGLVDWDASSTAHPAPMQTQDSRWSLVLLVLRAFGVWGVACVVRQQQNPESKQASGAAGGTILCLNPEERRKGVGGEAADNLSCSGGGVAPRALLGTGATQKRGLSRRGRMLRKREKGRERQASQAEWRQMLQCAALGCRMQA
jgi:hypothetical protein